MLANSFVFGDSVSHFQVAQTHPEPYFAFSIYLMDYAHGRRPPYVGSPHRGEGVWRQHYRWSGVMIGVGRIPRRPWRFNARCLGVFVDWRQTHFPVCRVPSLPGALKGARGGSQAGECRNIRVSEEGGRGRRQKRRLSELCLARLTGRVKWKRQQAAPVARLQFSWKPSVFCS